MLVDKLGALRGARLVLASGSPRRKEILNDILGLAVTATPSTFAEDLVRASHPLEPYHKQQPTTTTHTITTATASRVCPQDKAQFTPEGYVQENARIKAREVWAQLSAEGVEGVEAAVPPDLVIGGDTARQPETLSC